MSAVGSKMKRARQRKGLSSLEVANMLGVTRASVTNWEAGICTPPSSRVKKIAKVLGVNPLDLLPR